MKNVKLRTLILNKSQIYRPFHSLDCNAKKIELCKGLIQLNHSPLTLSYQLKPFNLEEDKILELIAEQPDFAFTKIVETYQERVYWHIRKLVYAHDDANDVVQNTFIKVYKNLNKFKGDSKLYSWLYRIATNESINFINQRAKRNNVGFEEVSYQKASSLKADDYFDGDEAALKLQKAVAKLPEKQRVVFQMKYFQNMKYDEIAEILETSVGGLKASYHHATKKIEEELLVKT